MMEEKKGYRKLKVWEKAHSLAIEVYRSTADFPRDELYGLTSQIRRAVFSVPTNIVEGHASVSKKEFLQFLNIANRSLVEIEYLLEVASELDFLTKERYSEIEGSRREVGAMLTAFTKSVKDKL